MSRRRRTREPRPKPLTELPLDDGARRGPEPWRTLDGVVFCHWDRWLLRLALTEPNGLDSIAHDFRRRAQTGRSGERDAEAMLAQIDDLKARLAIIGRTAEALLDDAERTSAWLRRKAFKRIWHDRPHAKTQAMCRTPRVVLEERAMRGNWAQLPVSPSPAFANLSRSVPGPIYDFRAGRIAIALLENEIEMASLLIVEERERMAFHRAVLTLVIEAMANLDDSMGELAELFREHEQAYLAAVQKQRLCSDRHVLRDLFELFVWEDYGLFAGVEGFLEALLETDANVALAELSAIVRELRQHNLERPLQKAVHLRRMLVASFGEDDR